MENDGNAADDQGWLQVKKRHRSSAKISVQSNPANKTRSSSQCNQPSAEKKITSVTFGQKSLSSRGEGHVTTQAKADSRNLFSLTQEVNTGRKELENEVINQESELLKLSLGEKGNVPVGSAYLIEEASDKIPKIKWGDLEDEELERSKNTGKSILSSPTQIVNQEDLFVTRFNEVQQLPDVIASSVVQGEYTGGDFNKVNEIIPKAVETIQPSDDALALSSEIHCNKETGVSNCDNSSAGTSISSAVTSSGLPIISPMGDLAPNEPGALSQENREPKTSGGDSVTAPVNLTGLQDTVGNASLSNSHLMNALDGDESGDYKESFRERLWTFLFWNLNRAVDELYLLCELECDVEQMEEAILVLEEAGSDFKALKSRVEEFEKVRKSSGQLPQDGNTVNVQSDHRRPHALSWEVRRMTTSSHRAEILSSSLEAFKKITQERASRRSTQNDGSLHSVSPFAKHFSSDSQKNFSGKSDVTTSVGESGTKSRKHVVDMELGEGSNSGERQNAEISKLSQGYSVHGNQLPLHMASAPDLTDSHTLLKDATAAKKAGYSKRSSSLGDKDKEKEKRSMTSLKSMDDWKEKRNWEDILSSPLRNLSRIPHSPALSRRSAERARVLHDKLMSPEKKKKTALDMKREADEKHARAMRIKSELENERVQRLQRTSEKLNRVSEWQAVRSSKLREEMLTRHQRSESRHEAHLAQVVKRAGDESSKVNEVRFITSLNEENKKLILKQKLQDSELRRAEKLQEIKIKQKEDSAREEAVLERRKLLEAEKLQRLAENQRKKEEAQVRREEDRKASSAAREARAIEQLRRKEVRAKAQQEEAELLAQKLAERLSESEMRRKFYLEQIKERASMDFRDQSSPSVRRGANREGMGKVNSANSVEDLNCISGVDSSSLGSSDAVVQQSWKRRAKKIRQRLMALKYEFFEPPVGGETAGIGYRTQVVAARAKIARWLQDLQKLRQARKEGAASIGLIVGDMIKFLEGKDLELQASRQAGLLDFIASALPASHISKPEACQVTIYLLRLLKVVLTPPVNRGYFIAQNLLPPVIPMLSAALENYIKISAASNLPLSSSSLVSSKISSENLESIAEVLEGFLWTVTVIIGHTETDERQSQMQGILVELVVAYQVIHRLRDLFALFDRPQLEGVPFPSSVLLGLNLLTVLTSRYRFIISINWEYNPSWSTSDIKDEEKSANAAELEAVGDSSDKVTDFDVASIIAKQKDPLSIQKDSCNQLTETSSHLNNTIETSGEPQKSKIAENITTLSQRNENSKTDNNKEDQNDIEQEAGGLVMQKKVQNDHEIGLKLQVAFVVSAIGETGLVGLPSLLTAVLLQANSKSSSEQGTYLLPSNFEEVATGVLKVLNNLALLDITLLQKMLARPDLRMEFFHLMSFLLSHCTAKWKAVTDQVGMLLLETLLLLGYFSLFHPGNQAVLRWGKSPTILHKVCDLPFVFFSDPELTPILAGTLGAACYGSEQNKGVVLQELSMDMLLSLLKSCRQSLTALHSDPYASENNAASDDPTDVNQPAPDSRKLQRDVHVRLNIGRNTLRGSRASLGRGGIVGSNGRQSKMKNQKESKGTKACDEYALKHNLPPDSSLSLMLHNRFPISFIDRVQEFFSAESTSM